MNGPGNEGDQEKKPRDKPGKRAYLHDDESLGSGAREKGQSSVRKRGEASERQGEEAFARGASAESSYRGTNQSKQVAGAGWLVGSQAQQRAQLCAIVGLPLDQLRDSRAVGVGLAELLLEPSNRVC